MAQPRNASGHSTEQRRATQLALGTRHTSAGAAAVTAVPAQKSAMEAFKCIFIV